MQCAYNETSSSVQTGSAGYQCLYDARDGYDVPEPALHDALAPAHGQTGDKHASGGAADTGQACVNSDGGKRTAVAYHASTPGADAAPEAAGSAPQRDLASFFTAVAGAGATGVALRGNAAGVGDDCTWNARFQSLLEGDGGDGDSLHTLDAVERYVCTAPRPSCASGGCA